MSDLRQHLEDLMKNIHAIERFTAAGRDEFLEDDKKC